MILDAFNIRTHPAKLTDLTQHVTMRSRKTSNMVVAAHCDVFGLIEIIATFVMKASTVHIFYNTFLLLFLLGQVR